jgi:hypothetical protein
MPQATLSVVIVDGVPHGAAIVPEGESSVPASAETVNSGRGVGVEEIQHRRTLLAGHPVEARRIDRIDEQRLAAGVGVEPNYRVAMLGIGLGWLRLIAIERLVRNSFGTHRRRKTLPLWARVKIVEKLRLGQRCRPHTCSTTAYRRHRRRFERVEHRPSGGSSRKLKSECQALPKTLICVRRPP